MKVLVILTIFSLITSDFCESKTFSRCGLTSQLLKIKGIKRSYLGTLISVVHAKRFETRCKLVRELLRIGMPNDMFLGQWVCLIEKVSRRDTSALMTKSSGKKFYGLYQIPNEWCREKKRGGLCNMTCEALLDEDIRDDTACALQIAEKHGFQYWSKWTTRCKNDNFITTEIYKCPDLMRLTPERSLSSNSQYRRSPPRLRRSAHRPRRAYKVTKPKPSRHFN